MSGKLANKIERERNPSLRRSRGERVYVGMSGGVDSSLSAALLVEAGYDVTGVYMKNWSQDLPGMKCPWAEDLADAKRVAVQLGIPFKVFDFEKDYKHLVVDYMVSEYKAGRTPNPDIMCNQEVKFGLFLKTALDDGADMIATGHYARIGNSFDMPDIDAIDFNSEKPLARISESPQHNEAFENSNQGGFSIKSKRQISGSTETLHDCLLRAKDENKDQTYFLYRITKEALSKTIFPIGNLTKPEVRAEAKKRGLITAGRRESQGICFVGNVGIKEFLSQYVETKPGDIIEQESTAPITDGQASEISAGQAGKKIGRHTGAIFYTFGQRHNLGIGGGLPYYVIGKDMKKNEVYVSRNLNSEGFWRKELKLTDVHWINERPNSKKKYQVRLRHRGKLLNCEIELGKTTILKLLNPERAIAPGQSAVIYDGEVVLGGGIVS